MLSGPSLNLLSSILDRVIKLSNNALRVKSLDNLKEQSLPAQMAKIYC